MASPIWFDLIWFDLIWFIVLNATFSNISAISWRPVLVVEEAGVPGENHRPWQATGKRYHLRCESTAPFCNLQTASPMLDTTNPKWSSCICAGQIKGKVSDITCFNKYIVHGTFSSLPLLFVNLFTSWIKLNDVAHSTLTTVNYINCCQYIQWAYAYTFIWVKKKLFVHISYSRNYT